MINSNPLLSRFNLDYINPTSLCRYATAPGTWRESLEFHSTLATDDYVRKVDLYYRGAIEKFGDAWWHLDIVNVLYAAAKLHRPKNYLEIGVRRGRSCLVVASACPDVNIFGCDIWMENYAGMENPGPGFVRNELARLGHIGQLEFLNGDSHRLIPELIRFRPELLFDLITVDGDHSEGGALADLETVIELLAPGGILVFDDIAHPAHGYLLDVWRRATGGRSDLLTYEYTETGYGIAFAIRQV